MHARCPKCLVLFQCDDSTILCDHTCHTESPPSVEVSVEAIKERHRQASPGPFFVVEKKAILGQVIFYNIYGVNGEYVGEVVACSQALSNSTFLTQSWNDTAFLIGVLDEEKNKVRELQERIELLESALILNKTSWSSEFPQLPDLEVLLREWEQE